MRKVGIPINLHEGTCGVGSSYYDYLDTMFEDVEIILLTPKHTIRRDLDLVLLPGGADVNPTRYGKAPRTGTGFSNPYQEYFDTTYLPKYIEMGTPVFGICRGFQSLNVHFGGTLTEISHPTNPREDGAKKMHDVFLNTSLNRSNNPHLNTILHTSVKGDKMGVNSRHHQGMKMYNLADSLAPIFLDVTFKKSNKFTCVEAFAHKTLPVIGVQWHPEDYLDDFSMECIDFLMDEKKSLINEKVSTKITHEEPQLRVLEA